MDGMTCQHVWVEEYYGDRCSLCGLFYAHGTQPWHQSADDSDTDNCDEEDTMTDQPKPTPVARPQCTEMHIDLLITTCERLTSNNQRLRELLRRWVAEFPYADVMLHDSELKRDSEAILNNAIGRTGE